MRKRRGFLFLVSARLKRIIDSLRAGFFMSTPRLTLGAFSFFPSMKTTAPQIELRSLDALIPYARNSRTHGEMQVAQIAASLDEFGMVGAIVVRDGVIAKGHGTIAGVRKLYSAGKRLYPPPGKAQGAEPYPEGTIPVLDATGWTDAQFRAFVIADNRLAMNAGWDFEMLAVELDELRDAEFDLGLLGFEQFELNDLIGTPNSWAEPDAGNASGEAAIGGLSDRFMIPPFSVLNAREGWWQARKRAWIALGIESEKGRGENLLKMSDTMRDPDGSKGLNKHKAVPGGGGGGCWLEKGASGYKAGSAKAYNTTDWIKEKGLSGGAKDVANGSGTSIFDPVLCELSYRWFSPPGGVILDPFAGGSVRGIVAAKLGRQYVGGELRQEQVDANREQADGIIKGNEPMPVWHCGDSRHIDATCKGLEADFVYSCPPYADLEVYSDNPADLSMLDYGEFRAAYFEIIKRTCSLLRNDRFAAFVVGEVRDIHIDSWLRTAALNAAVGGVGHSAHMDGYAVDFICPGFGTPQEIVKAISEHIIPYDQMIQEGAWVHISFAPARRQQILLAHFTPGQKTTYTEWIA